MVSMIASKILLWQHHQAAYQDDTEKTIWHIINQEEFDRAKHALAQAPEKSGFKQN